MKGVSWIFHISLGGGHRHKLAICAMAIVAADHGYKVERMDSYRPGQSGEVPDLIISREEKLVDGPRRYRKVFRYRVEVIDSNDPVPEPSESLLRGFDDVVKVVLKSGDDFCLLGHGIAMARDTVARRTDEPYSNPHPLCIPGLLLICARALP